MKANAELAALGRREFLLGAVGAATLAKTAAAAVPRTDRAELTAGVFSDLHISDNVKSGAIVEKALRRFRDAGVDAVVCTGDFVNDGTEAQYRIFIDVWERVFPDGVGRDGGRVERVFITGNHDVRVTGGSTSRETAAAGLENVRRMWREVSGDEFAPVLMKEVKGYKFICQQWGCGKEGRAFIEEHAAELKGDRPFFHLQHSHLRGTIPYAWITDNGKTTEVLKRFPNCVSLSGHSHWPLVDERSLWQGEFTAVNDGCMRYASMIGGRENGRAFGCVDPKTLAMPAIDTMNDAQSAMIMRVYADEIVFERLDVKYGLKLGGDFVVPWPISRESVSIETRAAKTPAPEFAAGAKAEMKRATGKNRRGEEVEQLFVEFPNCRTLDGSPARALDFEVVLMMRAFDFTKALVTKRVYSPGFYRGEAKDVDRVKCAFALDELPKPYVINDGPPRTTVAYRFAVRPCGTFGARGGAIFTEWVEL